MNRTQRIARCSAADLPLSRLIHTEQVKRQADHWRDVEAARSGVPAPLAGTI